MRLGQPVNRKITIYIRTAIIIFVLLFIVSFWREIFDVLKIIGAFFLLFLGFPFKRFEPSVWDSFNTVFFNCFYGFGAVFILWLFLVAGQALLPVNTLKEVYRAAWHLWLYIIRAHGPAIFVKDGTPKTTQEDSRSRGHGVIVVDFNSSIVLEERDVPKGMPRLLNSISTTILVALGLVDRPSPTRVCGPGIVFTRPNERLHGVADLRKQFRVLQKVRSYSREGIELYSNVNATFTVGQDPEPDALQVTYLGERRPDNLRVCVFKPVAGRNGKYLRLTELNDELDEADAREIHALASSLQFSLSLREYEPLPRHRPLPVFNQERVFTSVFAQATNGKKETVPWTDLPTRVASDFYREVLPQINYDELYDIKGGNENFPMAKFKRQVTLRMRNNGLLAYRLVQHCSDHPLEVNHEYHQSELLTSDVRQLTNPKLLRDRGIKVIGSSFGDLFPVSELVYKQRLDSWRAAWERELDITKAGRDLQAMRTRSRALTEAQENLSNSLSQILSIEEHSEEALVMLILQSMEEAATDPQTRGLLPGITLEIMRYLHETLMKPPDPDKKPMGFSRS